MQRLFKVSFALDWRWKMDWFTPGADSLLGYSTLCFVATNASVRNPKQRYLASFSYGDVVDALFNAMNDVVLSINLHEDRTSRNCTNQWENVVILCSVLWTISSALHIAQVSAKKIDVSAGSLNLKHIFSSGERVPHSSGSFSEVLNPSV